MRAYTVALSVVLHAFGIAVVVPVVMTVTVAFALR
jgi:hypothetical protein